LCRRREGRYNRGRIKNRTNKRKERAEMTVEDASHTEQVMRSSIEANPLSKNFIS
jgi:hypothetical protein